MEAGALPVVAVLVPVAAAIVTLAGGRRWPVLREPLALLATAVNLLVVGGICSAAFAGAGSPALVLGGGTFWALRVDALSALMMALIAVLSFLVVIYSASHMRALVASGKVAEERLHVFYALTLLFVAAMMWACATDNIIVLYLAVEATTLASALLVTFYWNRRALEAGYKYLLLLTVGITFALFGCVLVYGAHAGYAPGRHWEAMMLSQIRIDAPAIAAQAPEMLVLAMAFLLIGFGTKAGVIPFHPWLPDAHAEAPSPVSVLLSGIVIKVGAYALIRLTVPFFAALPALQTVLMLMGVVTMLVGIALVAAQDDLKRLLAYSSVSQIGYIMLGLGIGTYLGFFGALYHIINHALAKSALFLGAGAVEQATGSRAISKLGGLARAMPITAGCFIAACLALGGAPGLNGFMSKLTICLAAARAGFWWAALLAALTGVLTLVVMVKVAAAVFWGGKEASAAPQAREVPVAMYAVMVVLVLLCLALGACPLWIAPALDQAARTLQPLATATAQLPLP
jgi:proton-translocating NADH-quinone oxidoreductase chain N